MRVCCRRCSRILGAAETCEEASELQTQHAVLEHGFPAPTQRLDGDEERFAQLVRRIHLGDAHTALGAHQRLGIA